MLLHLRSDTVVYDLCFRRFRRFRCFGHFHQGRCAEAIKGAKAFAEKLNVNEYLYGFEIELEAATSEALTLEQFNISCPLNETELGEVSTSDKSFVPPA